jgi:hypothetical protein
MLSTFQNLAVYSVYAFQSISHELKALCLSHICQYISVRMFVVSSYGLGMTFQVLNEK